MEVVRRAARHFRVCTLAGCHVVVDPVARICAQHEAKVQVPDRQVIRHAEDPLRRGIVEGPPVVHVDDAVVVAVHVHLQWIGIVDRFAARVVLLLIDKERVDGLAWNEHLNGAADAARNAAGQDLLRLRAAGVRVDAGQLVGVVACRERDGPGELAGASLEDLGVETELKPRIAHAPDVRGDRRRETAGRCGDPKDEATGLLAVEVDRPTHPLRKEPQIEAAVRRARLFPADIRVDTGRT